MVLRTIGKYSDKGWNERYATLGDTAEGIFAEAEPLGSFSRLGWRRPMTAAGKRLSMKRMSDNIKHMPDFYVESGYLVEVMGLGKDGILKLKLSKYDGLKWWNKSGNKVALFVWNAHLRMWALISWNELVALVRKGRTMGVEQFKEGTEYYPIKWEWIEDGCFTAAWEGGE